MIEVQNIVKSFGEIRVLKGINLEIQKEEIVSVVGASGAGKTTLLQIMGTILPFDTGRVSIHNQDISMLNNRQMARFRNLNIGFVFQFHHLLPEFTAFENVCIPAYIAGRKKPEVEKESHRLLELLGLDHRKDHKPSELSGGEQQRVAVARALINNPAVILADEPSGNLDSKNKKELHDLFFRLRDELSQTIVIVTHDNNLADMSDRKITLQDGLVIDP